MTTATTRLHISPLTPALLDSILAPSVRSSATEISFHSIQTFPENSYGYVSLPAMEAEKLKKKLNGSILKGKKFKVEEARPKKRQRGEEGEDASESKPTPEKKSSKKRKAEDGVLEGYELPSDRHVKRGWTEPASAKKDKRQKTDKKKEKDEKGEKKPKTQAKSKYTETAECLFRTKTPANRSSVEAAEQKKDKKSKKNKSPNEVTVHEFSKTVTHPSFLRSDEGGKRVSTEFVEGKGWVDGEGNVTEPVSDKIKRKSYEPGQKEDAKGNIKPKKGSSVEEAPAKAESKKKKNTAPKEPTPDEPSDESESDWTSSSGSSSDGEATSDSESEASDASSEEADKLTASTATPTVLDLTPSKGNGTSDEKTEVHPLEALFKRPAPEDKDDEKDRPALEVNTQFTFFGGEDIEEEDEQDHGVSAEPHTPFSKRDLQQRGLRSAAPTPDTALPTRISFWPQEGESSDGDDDDDEEEYDDEYYGKASKSAETADDASGPKDETEFAKWFWEHRGENNRAWKRRRREAAKEKRQRENRKKGTKGRS